MLTSTKNLVTYDDNSDTLDEEIDKGEDNRKGREESKAHGENEMHRAKHMIDQETKRRKWL